MLKDATKFSDESVDLIYLDPPFFSKKDYENIWIKDKATRLGFSDKDWDELKDKVNPNIIAEYKSIEDRWRGGSNGIHVYIAYMRERLDQCWRVLKSTGSIYLHCDWHASHYLKIMLDEVFGYDNFRNEVIWHYRKWSAGWQQFQRNHDVLLFYSKSKSKDRAFNKIYMERSESTKKRFGNKKIVSGYDENGRRMPAQMEDADSLGVPMDDVWEIGRVPPIKQLFPTQKPESLLDRIIMASSRENDVVLDPFCGCGTTLVSSEKSGRKYIGIDISRSACDVMAERLSGSVRVIGCEDPKELQVMNPHDFARLVIVEKLKGTVNPKKSGDMGIDGWVELRTVPVQVKRWKHKVGRPEIDKFKTAIERDRKEKGMIVAHEFSRDAINEVARIKNESSIIIELRPVKDVFGWSKYDI